jgi:hypothetical protein
VGGDGADAERVLRLGRAHLGVVLGFLIADWAVYTIEKEMDEKMVKGTSQKWSENGEKCDNRGMRDRHSTGSLALPVLRPVFLSRTSKVKV